MKSRFDSREIRTHEQLRQAFRHIPEDPRTGFPAGYLSFAQELESRIAAHSRGVAKESDKKHAI